MYEIQVWKGRGPGAVYFGDESSLALMYGSIDDTLTIDQVYLLSSRESEEFKEVLYRYYPEEFRVFQHEL